jgi:hypothetical protein
MNKTVLGGIAVVAVVVIGAVAYKVISVRSEAAKWSGPMKEIVEENVVRDGSVTHARFVSMIDAPVDAVQKVVWDVEDSQQLVQNVKLSKLLESSGNTKLVEMNILALNLPLQAYTMQFTLHPEQHLITFKTIKSQAQDIEGEYKLEASPDGTRTRLIYTSTAKDKIAVPVPSILDAAGREVYVNTIRGIEKMVKQGGAPKAG